MRNKVLGFMENLTVQWLPPGRPEPVAEHRSILEMVMRAIQTDENQGWMTIKVKVERRTAEKLGHPDSD